MIPWYLNVCYLHIATEKQSELSITVTVMSEHHFQFHYQLGIWPPYLFKHINFILFRFVLFYWIRPAQDLELQLRD